jgi:superfamily II DNA/RNA helicase
MREERGKQRARQKRDWDHKTRKAREDAFLQDLFNSHSGRFQPRPRPEPEIISDDSSDEAGEMDPIEAEKRKIEESKRKIAELERDKPLWEAARREREQMEQNEERERQAAKRARERKAETERKEREYLERMAKEMEERQKREQEERQRREKERRHTQNRARWTRGPWTIQRALERYRFLCEQFDNAKFSSAEPLTFDDIPWPMLRCTFSVEDVEWSAVENFFASVKPHMRIQDYKVFVEKSHRRYVLICNRWNSTVDGCFQVPPGSVEGSQTFEEHAR